MESMYDRLGDLLKETLDAGEVRFVRVEIPESKEPDEKKGNEENLAENPVEKKEFENPDDFVLKNRSQPEYKKTGASGTIYHANEGLSFSQSEYRPRNFVYKKLSPEVSAAYAVLDVSPNSTVEEIKKAYKEKIKYYHPDRYDGNAVLQKVATDKTRQVVEAFKLISKFLEL